MIKKKNIIPRKIGPYFFIDLIGTGAHADVYTIKKDDINYLLCCKVISKKSFSTSKDIKHFYSEILNLSKCDHPNVLKIFDLLQDSINFYLITEYCSNGSLCDYLTNNGKIEENLAKKGFFQIISALNYLHEHKISHRDLKSDNIFINNNFELKIGDLGLSSREDCLLETVCGTLSYCPPEVLSGIPYDGIKSDIWSVGILLFTMVTAKLPWASKNKLKIMEQVKSGFISDPIGVSNECIQLIHSLTDYSPNNRPTTLDILKHKWLNNIQFENSENLKILPNLKKIKLDQIFDLSCGYDFSSIQTQSISKSRNSILPLLIECKRLPPKNRSLSTRLSSK